MSDTRIVLATPNVAYEQRVRQAFGHALNGDLRQWRDPLDTPEHAAVVRDLAASAPDVVALGPGLPLEVALGLAESLDLHHPEISVVLVAQPSPSVWEQALRAGVRDVVAPDAPDVQVRETFERALQTAARRRINLGGEQEGRSGRRVISVLSPKGGSGKTTIAANLALGLAQRAPGQVVVVDLDLQFGDIGTALRLVPEHTVADAARSGSGLDVMALKVYLTPHPADLYALCAPDYPAEGELVTAEQSGRIVELLTHEFRYVVVDTSAGLSEHTLAVLDASTDLVLVCAMDVSSVRSLRKEIEALDQLGMTSPRRHFVLNRADSRVGLDAADVAATLGMPVDVAVPSSRVVPMSMNQGSPVLESEPRSGVGKRLAELVNRFAEQPAGRTTGLWARRRTGS